MVFGPGEPQRISSEIRRTGSSPSGPICLPDTSLERIGGLLLNSGYTEIETALSIDSNTLIRAGMADAIIGSETSEAFVQALASLEAPILADRILASLRLGQGADSEQIEQACETLDKVITARRPETEWSSLLVGFGDNLSFQPSDQRQLAKTVRSAVSNASDDFEMLRNCVIEGAASLLNSGFVSLQRERAIAEGFASIKEFMRNDTSNTSINEISLRGPVSPIPSESANFPSAPSFNDSAESQSVRTPSAPSVAKRTNTGLTPNTELETVEQLVDILEQGPEEMRAFAATTDLSFVLKTPGLFRRCLSGGEPETVAIFLEALLVTRPQPSSSWPIIEHAQPEALMLMGDAGIHELRKRFDFCSSGHTTFAHAQILNALNSLEDIFESQSSDRGRYRVSSSDPQHSRKSAEYLVNRMLQVPESQFLHDRITHYQTGEQLEIRKFNEDELFALVNNVKKMLGSISGDFRHNSEELSKWVPRVDEILALPSHFQNVITTGFLRGKERILEELSNLYDSEVAGQKTEDYAESLLKTLKDQGLIRDYLWTAQFSTADKHGVDVRIYLEDGRSVDLDIKSSSFGKNETLGERRSFRNSKGLPYGVTMQENSDGSKYIHRLSEIVVIDPGQSDDHNLRAIVEAIKAGTSFPDELRPLQSTRRS